MRTFLFTFFVALTTASLAGQSAPNFWQEVQYSEIWLPENAETVDLPSDYKLLSLDFPGMASALRSAPAEGSTAARAGELQIQLPMPDGTLETFKVWDSPVMEPELAAKYPMIRSFSARGITNPHHTARLGYGPSGFRAVILSEDGGSFVMPYASNQTQYYVCSNSSIFFADDEIGIPTAVKIQGGEDEQPNLDPNSNADAEIQLRGGGDGDFATRRTYRFALSTTGEFANLYNNNFNTVLDKLVTSTEYLNVVTERDLDARLLLVANNDLLIFLDAANDPFMNSNDGGGLLSQNVNVLNSIIGLSSYDIGHVFTGGCINNVGGIAVPGSICSQNKASGVTCHTSTNLTAVIYRIAAHEMMHQFDGGHTFNNCSQATQDQYSSNSSWEPGSGSTILSYQGSCGSNNIPGSANVHYHGGNIGEVWVNTHQGGGNSCPLKTVTANHSPAVVLPYTNGFYIPKSTPFELEANATDEDGDPLTYCWEQLNLGIQSSLGNPLSNAPSFRVFDPSASPKRIFPRLPILLNNGAEITEVLPTYSRNLKFRCTVRDNNVDEGAGGITWQDVSFEVDGNAGPFLVTYPNTNTSPQKAGTKLDVTWNVANTDNSLVNCRSVNIKLSVDGGNTYPYTLACASPNDGMETVILPDVNTNTARIRVEAAGNIFFDISNQNFAIQSADEPGFSMSICPQVQQVCVPDQAAVEFNTSAILNASEPVNLEVLGGLPAGVSVSFSKNPIMPGENAVAIFDMASVTADGTFNVDVKAYNSTDTFFSKLLFNIVYSDFSALKGTGPVDGATGLGLLQSYTWTDLPQADLYEFQLASSPTFADSTILDEYTGTDAFYTPTDATLLESTIYYWRVRAINECGEHEYAPTNTFQTYTVSCANFPSPDVPKTISEIGLPTVVSNMSIIQNGTITDLNVRGLKGNHDALADLEVKLKSPAGTEITLFKQICGNVTQFDMNLNDEAPFNIACPPINGQTFKPQNPLSAFIGENTLGSWQLTVQVINTIGAGGNLFGWGLEFCGSISPVSPFVVKNDTLYVKPLDTRTIYNFELKVQDDDTPDDNLYFRVVNNTQHGYITREGVPLGIGNTFTMSDVHTQKIAYTNTDPDAVYDYFTFIVEDGTGGWLGTPRFNIVIDENALTGVSEEPFENAILLYPNPASQVLNVAFQRPLPEDGVVFVSNLQGRQLLMQPVGQAQQQLQVNTANFSNGIYFLTVRSSEGVITKKFMVQQ